MRFLLKIKFRLILFLIFLVLCGCLYKKSPDAKTIAAMALPKNTQVPVTFTNATNCSAVFNGWLYDFKDPQLNQLVNEAIKNNPNLVEMAAKVDIANATARKAAADLYPVVNGYGRLSFHSGEDAADVTMGLSGVAAFFGWELDFWGRVRSQAAAGEYNYQAMQADYAFAQESLAAQVARSWFIGNLATIQVSLLQQAVQTYQQLLRISRQQNTVGQVSVLNVALVEGDLSRAQDSLQKAQNAQSEAVRSLEILVGRYPSTTLQMSSQYPYLPPPPPAGLPSQLLERRWDIVAQQLRVAATFQSVQAAKAAQLPTLSLTSGAGLVSGGLASITGKNSFWNFGGNFLAPIFNGGALQANVDIEKGNRKQALAQYGQVALQAFLQVENALSKEQSLREQDSALTKALASDQKALQLLKIRYQVGQVSMMDVLQQQTKVILTKSDLAVIKSQRLLNRTDLYLALGGDFANTREKICMTP